MKFTEDILNRFQVRERKQFCDGQSSKGNNSKRINARVMILALCILIDIMKFHEDSLNGFQVREQTQFCDGQSSKGNNSKSINARVMILALCMSSNVDWYLYEVS